MIGLTRIRKQSRRQPVFLLTRRDNPERAIG
jgi:hypothetical protein